MPPFAEQRDQPVFAEKIALVLALQQFFRLPFGEDIRVDEELGDCERILRIASLAVEIGERFSATGPARPARFSSRSPETPRQLVWTTPCA